MEQQAPGGVEASITPDTKAPEAPKALTITEQSTTSTSSEQPLWRQLVNKFLSRRSGVEEPKTPPAGDTNDSGLKEAKPASVESGAEAIQAEPQEATAAPAPTGETLSAEAPDQPPAAVEPPAEAAPVPDAQSAAPHEETAPAVPEVPTGNTVDGTGTATEETAPAAQELVGTH